MTKPIYESQGGWTSHHASHNIITTQHSVQLEEHLSRKDLQHYYIYIYLNLISNSYYINHGLILTYNKNLKLKMGDIEFCWSFLLNEEFKCVTMKRRNE